MIPKFSTTAIGSLPFCDVDSAVEYHLNSLDIPCWPQLPKLSFYENMYLQFSENLPGLVIDEVNRKIYIKEGKVSGDELLNFFGAVGEKDINYFKISDKYAQGLYGFKSKIQKLEFVKGQITGPVSFGLSVKFENGEALFYDDQWRDIVIKHLKMKALWQVEFLKQMSKNVIIFVDEPYLSSLGSGYITILDELVQSSLQEIVEAIKSRGAITGIHCCGNTDWSKLINVGFDINIINYDTYNYAQSLLILPELIHLHLKDENNYIAWGIVPSSDDILKVSVFDLFEKIKEVFGTLKNKGLDIELLKMKSLLTPSCGTGTLNDEEAFMVYKKLKELKERLTMEVK